jgi:hypothetical protein
MTKKRLLQFGIIGCLVLVLAAGGFWAYRKGKLGTKADVLNVAPLNLTAVLPSAADDMPQNHWAQKYVDAIIKNATFGAGKNEQIIAPYLYDSTGTIVNTPGPTVASVKFMPDTPITNEQMAFYMVRLKMISPGGCTGNVYKDVNSSNSYAWACPQIEAAAKAGYFNGTVFAPTSTPGNFSPGSQFNVSTFKKILTNAGVGTASPPGYTCTDSCITTRVIAAAYMAYNAGLAVASGSSNNSCGDHCLVGQAAAATATSTSNDPYPSVYLQWNFPSDPNAGFDLGYEIWRLDPSASAYNLLYVQDPPEQGMEEGSDLGMFYDKSVAKGQKYTYMVLLMNRVGDYSNSASLPPTQLAQSGLIRRAHAAGTQPAQVTIQVP